MLLPLESQSQVLRDFSEFLQTLEQDFNTLGALDNGTVGQTSLSDFLGIQGRINHKLLTFFGHTVFQTWCLVDRSLSSLETTL